MSRAARSLGLAVVVALAAFFRLHDIDEIPPGFFGDEAADADVAAAIRSGEQFPVYVEEETKWGSREPLYHYLMAGVFTVFGETTTAVRLTSALIGIATVPFTFWLCRLHFGSAVALLTAALLAVNRWHVTMSRLGLRAILVPLWIVLTLLAASAFWRRRSGGSAVALGVVVGAGLYTYPSYWLVPPLLVAALAWNVARSGWGQERRLIGLAALALGAALVTAAPLIRYAFAKPEHFFGRSARTLSEGASQSSYRDGVMKVLFMLHLRGDENARHNLPGRPMLDPVTGFFFVGGLAYMLRSLVRNRGEPRIFAALIVLWLVLLLPSAVTDSAPHALRALGAVPAVCAIAAVGIHRLSSVPPLAARKLTRRAAWVFVLLAAGAWNYRDYFHDWARRPEVAAAFSSDVIAFFDRVAELGERHDVYAVSRVVDAPQVRFLNRHRKAELRRLDESAFVDAPGTRDRIYVVDTPALNALVADLYPGAEVLMRYSSEGRGDGRVYLVRRERLRRELSPPDRYAIERALAKDAND